MSMSFKASPDGTYGEILINGQVVAKLPVSGNAVIPNLVGTVSQSGGIPTGAVVEQGSGANGRYVRFADGTQICFFRVDAVLNIVEWIFPAAFVAPPNVSGSIISSTSSTNVFILLAALPTPTSWTVRKKFTTAAPGVAWNDTSSEAVSLVAIGRWF